MDRHPGRWLAGIVFLGLALRLAPLLANGAHPGLFLMPDSYDYDRLARNLLAGNGYSLNDRPPYEADVYRPPGLPVLLAAVYAAGPQPSVPRAVLVQVAASAALVLLTYRLARGLGAGTRAALGAAILLAVDPLSVIHANLLLTEVYSSLVVVGTGCLAAAYLRTGRRGYLLAAAPLVGLGILVHPMLVFVPFFLTAVPLLARRTRSAPHYAAALLTGVLALVPAAAWVARNGAVADYRGISCVAAINMLKYKAAGVMADLRGTTREEERDRLTAECAARLPPGATRGAKYRLWQNEGAAILLAHPFVYAKVHAEGMFREVFGPSRDNLARLLYGAKVLDADGRVTDAGLRAAPARGADPAREALRHLAVGVELATVLGALAGVAALLARRDFRLVAALALPAAYVLALSGGPEGEPRFRVVYVPFLCVLAAAGLPAVAGRVRAVVGRLLTPAVVATPRTVEVTVEVAPH